MEKLDPYIVGQNAKWVRHCGKSLAFPQKIKYTVTYDPAIPVLGIYS